MVESVVAALFVLLAWWGSTAAILLLDGLPRRTFRYSMGVCTTLAIAGLYGLWWSRDAATKTGAYVAFLSALAVWAWHEMAFLLGLLSGPRKQPLEPGARGWRRFSMATAAILHHELALFGTVLLVVAIGAGGHNPVGSWTFLVLWVMRLSAKLNLFLGVRNCASEFLPEHLRYMASYFRTARWNSLMPLSLVGGSVVVVLLVAGARAEGASVAMIVGRTLVATLLSLAVIEHLFLALPMPDALLWRWAVKSAQAAGDEARKRSYSAKNVSGISKKGSAPVGISVMVQLARPRTSDSSR